jgi:hypothetical protein
MADNLEEALNSIYSKIPRANLAYSGNGSGGTYAHLTQASMEKQFHALSVHTGFGRESGLVDIGGGLDVPALHAATAHCSYAAGIEIDPTIDSTETGVKRLDKIKDKEEEEDEDYLYDLPELCQREVASDSDSDHSADRAIAAVQHGGDANASIYARNVKGFTVVFMFDEGFVPGTIQTRSRTKRNMKLRTIYTTYPSCANETSLQIAILITPIHKSNLIDLYYTLLTQPLDVQN